MAAPRLLLIHGFLSGGVAWDNLRAELPGIECAAPDLPGYGAAIADRSPYSLDHLVESLAPVVSSFAPTHVLGHSMGGIVALALARRFPGHFARIGVAGLPIFASRADGLAFLHRRARVRRLLLWRDTLSHRGCEAVYRSRRAWFPLAPLLLRRQPSAHALATVRHTRESHEGGLNRIVFAGLIPGLVAGLDLPVAALHGGDDRNAPLDRVLALASSHGWDLQIAPTAGHQLVITRPRLTARWVRAHLLAGQDGEQAAHRP